MQCPMNILTSPFRSLATGTSAALFSVLALCLCATDATAQKNIVVSQESTLGWFLGGGQDSGQSPLSETFAVGADGSVYIGEQFGYALLQITRGGAVNNIAPWAKTAHGGSNLGPTAVDSYGSIYVAADGYVANIYKIPFNSSTGMYTSFATEPTANCVGGNSDTAPCLFAPGLGAQSGFSGLAFDASGNLWATTSTAANTKNTIYECNATCQTSSAGTPTAIYTDANPLGGLAFDPWGNLFFIDGNNSTGKVTNLNELPLQSGAYASTPTVLLSYTNKAGYGNGFGGPVIASNGTLYFSTNADGIFAIPNTQSGGPNPAAAYAVGTAGGYGPAIDSKGNLYLVHYGTPPAGSGFANYAVDIVLLNNLPLPAATVSGAATTATANIIDSAGACTPSLTLAATEFGVATNEIAATAASSCGVALGTGNGTFSPAVTLAGSGAVIPATVTFTPAGVGERSAALTIKDSTNSASATAVVTGVGQGALGNLDPGVSTAYATGFTTPYSVSVDAAGDLAIADESAGKVFWIPAGSPAGTAPTSIGTGFGEPAATAFDANGNLYIADFKNDNVVEIPNLNGVLVPASQSIAVANTVTFGGTALSKPAGLGIGPDGVVYIADLGNSRVVSWNPNTGQTAVPITGVTNPWQVAVDASNNIYVASVGNGNVLLDSAGALSTFTPTGVTQPWGVAVDPSGSLVVSDRGTGNIVWVPNLSGTLSAAGSVLIEKNPSSARAIALDRNGNLYTTDSTGKAVYAIQRTAASLNFGAVQDGVSSNTGTIYVEVTGNMPVTLATLAFTAPTSSDFTLASTVSNNKCTGGSSGNPGQDCQLQSVFTPPPGTPAGPVSATATLNSNAINVASATIYLTGSATLSSVKPQVITNFNPPTSIFAGQQITLSATGGGSGNPIVFSIDAASACQTCATVNGATLTASATGSIIVDANQAAGTSNGTAYAAAAQVQAAITIANATAADVPTLLMSQIVWSYQSGAFTDGQNPAGGSFAVTQNGEVVVGTSYNNKADFVNAATGALIQQVSINGPGGFTIDSNNNLYMSHLYGNSVLKIPYVKGAYATLTDTAPPNCTGADTTLCTVATAGSGGVKAIAFDSSGNLYMVTVPSSTGASAIYQCPSSCQTGGTATLVYSDTNAVSQVAVDPWGNLFFADGVYANATNFGNDEVSSSNLYELPYTAGKGFAATPVLLQTLTDASPSSYDNQLDGVAVASTGTVYYATQNEGTFAVPNTKTGGPDTAHQYMVSLLGAKGMELDGNGNEWVVVYHAGGDNIGEALLSDLIAPTAQLNGAATTAAFTVVDNAAGCGSLATLAFASSNPEFSASAAGATCSATSASFSTPVTASSYTATLSFSATAGGPQSATLSASDTANGGQGTATVSGVGAETPQTIAFTAPTTTTYVYAPGMTITLGANGGASNNTVVFTVDPSSTGMGTIAGNTLTVTQAGNIVIDANQPGGLVNGIYYQAATQAQLTLNINQAAQSIVFPQPASPVTYSPTLTVALSANGGASGNTVAFSVDPSSTGAGTISTSTLTAGTSTATLTVTQAGNIVIDANQGGNVNYLVAAQTQQTVVVNKASQTIAFIPLSQPFHYIVTGVTLSIQATGGGSNSAIVFTVDKSSTMTGSFSTSTVSGATSTTTLTMPANQSPTSGAIVVDATQPGNANYLASAQTQFTINVLAPLPTQSITFAVPQTQVGGTTLTLSATASSGFPVTYTSSTTSVCTVSGSTATFAKVTSAGTCTITAAQPGDNQYFAAAAPVTVSFTVNPPGQVPAMSLNLSLSSLTIQPGTVGLSQITLTSQNNFTGTVTFTCTGLPTGYSCAFNPNPLSIPEGGSGTTTLTVTPPATAALMRRDFRPFFPATLAVALCLFGFRKRNRLQLLLLLTVTLVGLGMFTGCGGSSGPASAAATTSTATITATSGSMTTSATLTVILE